MAAQVVTVVKAREKNIPASEFVVVGEVEGEGMLRANARSRWGERNIEEGGLGVGVSVAAASTVRGDEKAGL